MHHRPLPQIKHLCCSQFTSSSVSKRAPSPAFWHPHLQPVGPLVSVPLAEPDRGERGPHCVRDSWKSLPVHSMFWAGFHCSGFSKYKELYSLGHNRHHCQSIQDDVLNFSCTTEEHDARLRQGLPRLQDAGWKPNKNKCIFQCSNFNFLDISWHLRELSHAMIMFKPPCKLLLKETWHHNRSLLDLLTYRFKFIPNFATIVRPLHVHLRKDVPL